MDTIIYRVGTKTVELSTKWWVHEMFVADNKLNTIQSFYSSCDNLGTRWFPVFVNWNYHYSTAEEQLFGWTVYVEQPTE